MERPEIRILAERIASEKEPEVLKRPKYVQLADHISHMIEAGEWKPGDRIPSEAEMARTVPASLGTIQKVLGRLVEQGAIVREHCRGTFVNGPRSLLGPWHLRFIGSDGRTLLPIHQKVLDIGKVAGEPPWGTFLGDASFYLCIKRMIDVGGEFNALSRFYVSGDLFGSLLDMPVTALEGKYIRETLRSRFGTPTLRLVEEVSCDALPDDACRSLGLPPDSVGMIFHIMSHGYRDEPISYHLVHVPSSNRRLLLSENVN